MKQILENVGVIRKSLRQAAEGPNTILGAGDVKGAEDPIIGNMHILVADDEPNIRNTISDVLRKYHARITLAASGSEAIALIEQDTFDLVVSDIKMPDKNGYDVFAAAHKRNCCTPVILMTGFGIRPQSQHRPRQPGRPSGDSLQAFQGRATPWRSRSKRLQATPVKH